MNYIYLYVFLPTNPILNKHSLNELFLINLIDFNDFNRFHVMHWFIAYRLWNTIIIKPKQTFTHIYIYIIWDGWVFNRKKKLVNQQKTFRNIIGKSIHIVSHLVLFTESNPSEDKSVNVFNVQLSKYDETSNRIP